MLCKLLIIYLAAINIVAFACYGADKRKAKRGKWRISEATLLLLAAAGGAFGAYAGMQTFRHKTKHWKFRLLVPLFAVAWIALIIYLTKEGAFTM